MLLGKIVGTIVSTQKDHGLAGHKLLIVQNVDLDIKLKNSYLIASDAIGAGMGELVVVVQGSSARMAERTLNQPVDAAIIAIVDNMHVEGQSKYSKGSNQ
jgi:microcompartment protein CcmK/EutM